MKKYLYQILVIALISSSNVTSASDPVVELEIIKLSFYKDKEFCENLIKNNDILIPAPNIKILHRDKTHSYFIMDIDNDGIKENVIRESTRIRGVNNDTYFVHKDKTTAVKPKEIFWELIKSESTFNIPNKWALYGKNYSIEIPGHKIPLEIMLDSTIVEVFKVKGETYFFLLAADNEMERDLRFSAIIKPEANGYVTDMCYFQVKSWWQ